MHKVLLFLCGLLWVGSVWAAPVSNLKKTVTQPDGSKLELLLSGNEYSHRLHDAENYSVIRGKDGYYYYAINDAEGNVVPSVYRYGSVSPAQVGIPKGIDISEERYRERWEKMHANRPEQEMALMGLGEPLHLGKMHNIVVFIRFADDDEFDTPRKVFDTPFNGDGVESLKNFYEEASYGKFTIETALFPACDPEKNLSYQDVEKREVFEDKDGGDPTELMLLKRALKSLTAELEAYYTPGQLDKNGDGKVDNVTFIIRGEAGAWSSLLWAHKGWLGSGEPVLIHGLKVQDYILQPEASVNVRTTCHEMYHGLGAPDLYLYNQNINYGPVGVWDLMGGGFVHMSAYMKWKYTNHLWVEDIPEITKSGRYSLKPLAKGNQNVAYRINVGRENEARQWLVLEFRKRVGIYEKNLPGSGLVVSRVMPDLNGNSNPPWEVYVYCPGGTDTLTGNQSQAFLSKESGRRHLGTDTDPQLFLAMNSDRLKSGLAYVDISDVSEAKSDEIFFTVTLPEPQMDTIRLKPGGTGDGSSWANAAGDLKKAIQRMYDRQRGEIWLAGGSWQFTDDTLYLREYTNIYGGFAGTETSKNERQLADRNGDGKIDPWEFKAVSKLEFSGKSRMEVEWNYSHRPVSCEGVTIAGLTGSIVVPWGGVFSRMEICNNAPAMGQNGFIEVLDNAVLEKSYLHHNEGEGRLICQRGGIVRNCVITNNHSSKASLLTLGNSGGLWNCLVANNETDDNPGITVDQSIPGIWNNTFVHNSTRNTTGWIVAPDIRQAKIQMYNTILWGNTPAGIPEVDQASVYVLQSCAIQGYQASDFVNKPDEVKDNICLEENNQGSEVGKYYPAFKRASSGQGVNTEGYVGVDWSCEGNSPCIDAGTADKGADRNIPDLAGHLRIMNDRVDIGAYEYLNPVAATIELKNLTQVYTGEPLQPLVTTVPEGLDVKITYNGQAELPLNGGTYTVVAEVADPSYIANQTAVFKIEKATQTLSFEELPDAYVGEERVLYAVASSRLPVVFQVDNHTAAEIQEDTVVVFKQVANGLTIEAICAGNENYQSVSVSHQLEVMQNKVTVSLEGMLANYDKQAHPVVVHVDPVVSYEVTYNGIPEVPVNAGKYVVKAMVNASGYAGYCIDTLIIAKTVVTLEMGAENVVFNATEQWPEVKNVPAGVNVIKTANGEEKAPYHAGNYQIEVIIDDPNYEGCLQKEFVIERMPVEIVLDESSLKQVFSAGYKDIRVTTIPADHEIDIIYEFESNGSLERPYWAGNYKVTIGVDEMDYYAASITRKMVIERAPVSIALDRSVLEQSYSGKAFQVTAVTSPIAGLKYQVLYNGSTVLPVHAGDYEVTAEIQDYWRYEGYDTVTLHIRKATQQIVFDQPTEIEMDVSYFPLKAVASSGLKVEYESSASEVASIEGNRLVFHQGGTTVVTASQAGNDDYTASDPVSLTFTLIKLNQEIIWEQQLVDLPLVTEPTRLVAEASSGLVVEYASDNEAVAVVNDGLLQLKGTGTATITASQVGNGFYTAATPVSKTITVINVAEDLEALDLIVAGGGYNQKFKIKDVEFLDHNHLIVFNKAGQVVYSRDNYDNNYDMGQVPAGTYYYVFTYLNATGNKLTKKGFVEVVRN